MEVIKTTRFKANNRTYTLELLDVGHNERIGYRLWSKVGKKKDIIFNKEKPVFKPGHGWAWDSDKTAHSVMTFITLRKGDTDEEYFENYTQRQIEFRDTEAEGLAVEVYGRWEHIYG
jgi:hypothetical protein